MACSADIHKESMSDASFLSSFPLVHILLQLAGESYAAGSRSDSFISSLMRGNVDQCIQKLIE